MIQQSATLVALLRAKFFPWYILSLKHYLNSTTEVATVHLNPGRQSGISQTSKSFLNLALSIKTGKVMFNCIPCRLSIVGKE